MSTAIDAHFLQSPMNWCFIGNCNHCYYRCDIFCELHSMLNMNMNSEYTSFHRSQSLESKQHREVFCKLKWTMPSQWILDAFRVALAFDTSKLALLHQVLLAFWVTNTNNTFIHLSEIPLQVILCWQNHVYDIFSCALVYKEFQRIQMLNTHRIGFHNTPIQFQLGKRNTIVMWHWYFHKCKSGLFACPVS